MSKINPLEFEYYLKRYRNTGDIKYKDILLESMKDFLYIGAELIDRDNTLNINFEKLSIDGIYYGENGFMSFKDVTNDMCIDMQSEIFIMASNLIDVFEYEEYHDDKIVGIFINMLNQKIKWRIMSILDITKRERFRTKESISYYFHTEANKPANKEDIDLLVKIYAGFLKKLNNNDKILFLMTVFRKNVGRNVGKNIGHVGKIFNLELMDNDVMCKMFDEKRKRKIGNRWSAYVSNIRKNKDKYKAQRET